MEMDIEILTCQNFEWIMKWIVWNGGESSQEKLILKGGTYQLGLLMIIENYW